MTQKIVNKLYKAYGTDSGILFGIKERGIVESIVGFTVRELLPQQYDPDYSDKQELQELRSIVKQKDDEIENVKREMFHLSAEITYVSDGYNRTELQQEIEKLKGFIEAAHKWGASEFSEGSTITVEQSFNEFKRANNL